MESPSLSDDSTKIGRNGIAQGKGRRANLILVQEPQQPQDYGSFNLTINAINTLPFDLSSIAAGLFEGVKRVPASHHVAAAVSHADSHVLQPADFEEAEADGDPLPLRDDDGRAPHLREPEPGHRDPVSIQGQEEAATAAEQ